ncbi:nucleoporin NUP42 [Parambassis ranga]|uniref:Nucleoporin NUP42 n=1 Tax=Parambassis ranga TaxID=210632 RepID=A0A6P7KB91_9TELE|nr:nucleoporin-like protein 2 [Parambassis ranga]
MTVCSFFLQGRCRYGEKCWNEHPRGGNRGGGGGYNDNYNRSSVQQQPRGGGGGFGNRVWVNPSQKKGGFIQPSSFSSHGSDDWGRERGGGRSDWGREGGGGGGSDWGRGGGGGSDWGRGGGGGSDWGRGGGGGSSDWGQGGGAGGGGSGRRDNMKSSEFSFSNQNRFSTFNPPSSFDRGGRGGGGGGGGGGGHAGDEDDDKKLEVIQTDIDIWESSGQWGFSCYSSSKAPLPGFTDLSPEELRLEYYTAQASGDLQGYINGVNQLLNQWKSRVQELKMMNASTRAAVLAELNGSAPPASSDGFGSTTGFGSSTSSFGSKGFGAPAPAQASSFSFSASSTGSSSAGFGSAIAAPTQPPSGFGSSVSSSTASAVPFSFATPTTDKPAAPVGFGSASGFSFTPAANMGGGFGTSFGADTTTTAGSSNTFGQTGGGFGATATPSAAGAAGGASDSLFSTESTLTQEELNQFKAKRFTLGQIPLKPPPANMLVV